MQGFRNPVGFFNFCKIFAPHPMVCRDGAPLTNLVRGGMCKKFMDFFSAKRISKKYTNSGKNFLFFNDFL